MGDFALLESQKLISCKIWVIEKSWNFHTVKFMSPKATWLFSSSNSKHALFAPKLATLLKPFLDLSYPGITVGTKQTVAGFWVSRIDYFKAKNFRSSDLYLQNSIAPFLPYTLYWINGFLSWYRVFHLTFSKKQCWETKMSFLQPIKLTWIFFFSAEISQILNGTPCMTETPSSVSKSTLLRKASRLAFFNSNCNWDMYWCTSFFLIKKSTVSVCWKNWTHS